MKNRNLRSRQLAKGIALSLLLGTSLYIDPITYAAVATNALPVRNTSGTYENVQSVNTSGTTMTITQAAGENNAIIDWLNFNIGSGATVNVKQYRSAATLLNRVAATGGMSEIYGKLNATGNIIILNPNGALFDGNAVVNVGGLAVYAAHSTDNSAAADNVNQGNISVQGNAKLNVGIGYALAQASALNIGSSYAVGISSNSNKIILLANGDINLGGTAQLNAVDKTTVTGVSTIGEEGFEIGASSSSAYGQVIIRSDANSDDNGTVKVTGTPKIKTQASNIYYNPVAVKSEKEGVSYNKKDYKNGVVNYSALMNSSSTSATNVDVKSDGTYTKSTVNITPTANANAFMLVNNIAQLQDISDADTGNLAGRYALGKNINAAGDTASYYDKTNGILYRPDANGKIIAISVTDGGTFNANGTTKTVGAKTISYDNVTTTDGTYTYDGSNTSDTVYTLKSDSSITSTDYTRNTSGTITYNSKDYTLSGSTVAVDGASYTINGNEVTVNSNSYNISGSTVSTTQAGITYTITGGSVTAVDAEGSVNIPSEMQTSLLTAAADVITVKNVQTVNANMDNFKTNAETAKPALTTAFSQFAAIAADASIGQSAKVMNSANWNNNKGFEPIGNSTAAFNGTFDGFGGDGTHSIANLTIQRPDETNVGLFGVAAGAALTRVNLYNTKIEGKENVGGVVGQLTNGAALSSSHNYGSTTTGHTGEATDTVGVVKSTTESAKNIGGLVGLATGSATSILSSSNSATVIGRNANGNPEIQNVGGIAGSMENGATGKLLINVGNVFGETNTGGLSGNMSDATIVSTGTTSANYNNGKIDGKINTGGIVGNMTNSVLEHVYNTNEGKTLNTQISGSIDYIKNALNNKSEYGQVTGKTNTGGIAGQMSGTSKIDTAYNAGNITGVTNTGGITGLMVNGTIVNAYNADNNTVLTESLPATLPASLTALNLSTDAMKMVAYYSFYKIENNAPVWYYFVPESGAAVSLGAIGHFLRADGTSFTSSEINAEVPLADRFYLNRMAYRDANITGSINTGGIVGTMTNGSVATVYNAGTVLNTGDENISGGALIGKFDGGTLNNSFFVTGADKSTGKEFAHFDNAVGADSTIKATLGTDIVVTSLEALRKKANVKTYYSGDEWLGSITKIDADSGYTVYAKDGTTYYFTPERGLYTDKTVANNNVSFGGTVFTRGVGDNIGYYYDTNGNKYTLSTNDTTLTMTPVTAGSGTTFTVNAEKVSSNQGEEWLVYEDQTLPLLKDFMNDNDINRVFVYDGTTHNLRTDDVAHLYGRADFENGAGKNVQMDGHAASSEHVGSSEYYYDNSSLWSPQHGYKVNPTAAVVITPTSLNVTVTGEKTYGTKAVQDYYIYVPTKIVSEDGLSYTTVNNVYSVSGNSYVLIDNTLTLAQIKTKAKTESKYVVAVDGFVTGEGLTAGSATDASVNKFVYGMVTLLSGKNSYQGNDFYNAANGDSQQLNASTYNLSSSLGGLSASYNNYNIEYTGSLLVNKADLFYTLDGTRIYGDANSTGTYTYTLVNIAADEDASSANGVLKSWDADELSNGTNITSIISNNKNYTLQGKPTATSSAKTIGQTGSGGAYYQVLVDADGNPTSYVLTNYAVGSLALTDNELKQNYNLKWVAGGTAAGTATAANSTFTITPAELLVSVNGQRDYGNLMNTGSYDVNASALTDQKYNITVTGVKTITGDTAASILDGTKLKTALSGVEGTDSNEIGITTDANDTAYNIKDNATYTGSNIDVADTSILNNNNYKVVNGNHTLKIDKADLNYLVTGSRVYGDANSSSVNDYDITFSGLKNGQTLDKTKMNVVNNTLITADAGSTQTVAGLSGVADAGSADFKASNYNIITTVANNIYTITPADLTYVITGTRVYGEANSTTGKDYSFTFDGLKNGQTIDGAKLTVANNTSVQANAGSDQTVASASGFNASGSTGFKESNYNISTVEANNKYTITPASLIINIDGSRIYGDTNDTSDYNYSAASGLKTWDQTKFNNIGRDGLTVNNTSDVLDDVNSYSGKLSLDATSKKTVATGLTNNYNITYTDSFTINKADLTYVAKGTRVYGEANSTTGKDYSFTFDGLKNGQTIDGDKLTVTNNTSIQANVGSDQTVASASGFNASGSTGFKESNYNISTVEDNNKYTITPASLTINIDGSRIYGDTNDTSDYNYSATSGLKTWDQTKFNNVGWDGLTVNNTSDVLDDVNSYTGKLSLDATSKKTVATGLTNNYNIAYTDSFAINKADLIYVATGTRVYGESNSTTGQDYSFTFDGLKNGQTIDGDKLTVTNNTSIQAKVGSNQTVASASGFKTGSDKAASSVSGFNGSGSTGFKESNYNITTVEANNKYTITPTNLIINIDGSRIYGNTNDTSDYNYSAASGLKTWDQTKFDNVGWDGLTVNNTTGQQDNVGNYTGKLNLDTTSKNTVSSDLNNNYNITYTDSFDIIKRSLAYDISGERQYGTGNEHTTYQPIVLDGITSWDQSSFSNAANITNTADRTTAVGQHKDKLSVDFNSLTATQLNNYEITGTGKLNIVKANFIYTADKTEYYQGSNIPTQTGSIVNSYGEDVSDLVGSLTWPTPANYRSAVGYYEVIGHGSNDASGNYDFTQNQDNYTALRIKVRPTDPQTEGAKAALMYGGYGPMRRPLLDIRYLTVIDQGINRGDDYKKKDGYNF